jgi:hypothetical protein
MLLLLLLLLTAHVCVRKKGAEASPHAISFSLFFCAAVSSSAPFAAMKGRGALIHLDTESNAGGAASSRFFLSEPAAA